LTSLLWMFSKLLFFTNLVIKSLDKACILFKKEVKCYACCTERYVVKVHLPIPGRLRNSGTCGLSEGVIFLMELRK
jgi:hypothetical protein